MGLNRPYSPHVAGHVKCPPLMVIERDPPEVSGTKAC